MNKLQAMATIAMGKTYELSLVKSYVARWTMQNAVRELIQNALDSDSPFVYEFKEDDGNWSLALTSEFAQLTPQSLLLGATSKAQDEDAIGSFGEGYKIALLVLTNVVETFNGGTHALVTACLEQSQAPAEMPDTKNDCRAGDGRGLRARCSCARAMA